MNRRRVLSLVAAGTVSLAGCLGGVGGSDSPQTTAPAQSTSDRPTESPTGTQSSPETAVDEGTATPTQPVPEDAHTPYSLNQETIEDEIHRRVNQERKAADLGELLVDPILSGVARRHSRNMAVNGYVGHEQPDGTTRKDRYAAADYGCQAIDELPDPETGTVGKTWAFRYVETTDGTRYPDTEEEIARVVVQDWMAARDVRPTVLAPRWGLHGIGAWLVNASNETAVYVTQNFCDVPDRNG